MIRSYFPNETYLIDHFSTKGWDYESAEELMYLKRYYESNEKDCEGYPSFDELESKFKENKCNAAQIKLISRCIIHKLPIEQLFEMDIDHLKGNVYEIGNLMEDLKCRVGDDENPYMKVVKKIISYRFDNDMIYELRKFWTSGNGLSAEDASRLVEFMYFCPSRSWLTVVSLRNVYEKAGLEKLWDFVDWFRRIYEEGMWDDLGGKTSIENKVRNVYDKKELMYTESLKV